MGEYAEMMLDGTCCCSCGEFLGGDANGFPEYCTDCKPESLPKIKISMKINPAKAKKIVPCSNKGCARKFVDDNAMRQHLHHFHKVKSIIAFN